MREIYAEIPKRKLPLVDADLLSFPMPHGVRSIRKIGSRTCYFEFDDSLSDEQYKRASKYICDKLDDFCISWQEC